MKATRANKKKQEQRRAKESKFTTIARRFVELLSTDIIETYYHVLWRASFTEIEKNNYWYYY